MRISDWSSDVCSSDLPDGGIGRRTSFRCWRSQGRGGSSPLLGTICSHQNVPKHCRNGGILPFLTSSAESEVLFCSALFQRDRKSVVKGKSVSVRVDLGGRRIFKKKKTLNDKNI